MPSLASLYVPSGHATKLLGLRERKRRASHAERSEDPLGDKVDVRYRGHCLDEMRRQVVCSDVRASWKHSQIHVFHLGTKLVDRLDDLEDAKLL